MNLLVVPSQYPYSGYPFCGIFNERAVGVFCNICENVEVLSPRPFVPPLLSSLSEKWKTYATASSYEHKNGVSVNRPIYPQIPGIWGAFSTDWAAYVCSREISKKIHRQRPFDVILSFDLSGTGRMAWRIGQYLNIPSAGWVTGRNPSISSFQKGIARALSQFDLVFYQSQECFQEAASLLGVSPSDMEEDQHMVLARGILDSPSLPRDELRKEIREQLGITKDQILVLNIGRVVRDKGVFELLDAMALASARDPRVRCVLVGAMSGFDDTEEVENIVNNSEVHKQVIKILPACSSEKVWEYLCAADVFAFTSHHDGMPNSLLEAMVMGVPAIAFAIPPVVEIEAGQGGLLLIPPFNAKLFSEAILRLAKCPQERGSLGEAGRAEVLDRFMMDKNMAIAHKHLTRIVGAYAS